MIKSQDVRDVTIYHSKNEKKKHYKSQLYYEIKPVGLQLIFEYDSIIELAQFVQENQQKEKEVNKPHLVNYVKTFRTFLTYSV